MNRRNFLKQSAVSGILLGSFCKSGVFASDSGYDIIIKNGTIIDGSGSEPFIADIAIKDDRISEIASNIPPALGKTIIEAKGLVVSPGFIDIHTHSSGGGISHNYIYQGVTTEIGGNCGKTSVPNGTSTIAGQLLSFEKQANLTNFGTLVGHAPIRNAAMGLADRRPTADELRVMKKYVAQSLEEGAFGLSSGLAYVPGFFSDADEMTELCKVVKQYDAIYTTHMRDESLGILDSIDETLQVAKTSGGRVEISHLKMSRAKAWPLADEALRKIAEAKKGGIDVACDVYPYTAWNTFLTVLFPKWSREGDQELLGQCPNLIRRLNDAALDAKLRDGVAEEIELMGGPQNIIINGKSVAQIAQAQDKLSYDVMKQTIIQSNAGAGVIGISMKEENVEKIIAFPLTMIASDGWAQGSVGVSSAHPRNYGSFPRVIGHYARDKGIISLPQAIKKMTSQPAEHFHIKDRGILVKGKFADITIFDYETIIDKATFEVGNQKPEGIEYVLVNGKVVAEKGQLTGITPGKILRRV